MPFLPAVFLFVCLFIYLFKDSVLVSKKLLARSPWLLAGDMNLPFSAIKENNLSVLTVA